MDGISDAFSTAANGLNTASRQFAATAQQIAAIDDGPIGTNVDDLTRQTVDLINEKDAYEANAVVVKTAGQILGTLLDVLDIDAR